MVWQLVRLVWFGLFLTTTIHGLIDNDNPQQKTRKCGHSRAHGMIAADCYGVDLTAVPTDLSTDVKVLSLTHNRIRQLSCHSFDPYPHLIYLYLDDNMISYIPEGVFKNLFNLEVVDLSLNSLKTIPSDLLSFSRIRKLYLNENLFGDNTYQSLQNISGIVNLQFLSMSSCTLTKIPPLNNFLALTDLNVSHNALTTINPEDLAPACNLKRLDLNQNDRLFENDFCSCQRFETYLTESNITLVAPYQLNCSQKAITGISDDCSNLTATDIAEVRKIFNSCKLHSVIMAAKATSEAAWKIGIWIIGSIAVIGIVLATIYYMCYRKKDQQNENNLSHPMHYRNEDAHEGETYPLKSPELNIT